MDPSELIEYTQSKKTPEVNSIDSGNVLQPTRVRRAICSCDEMDRFISDNRHYFLLHVGILFWIILLFSKEGQNIIKRLTDI
jgi:hypothetical protein